MWWFSGSRGECYHHHHHFEGKEKIIKPNRVECFPCEVPCKTISFFSLFFFVRFINQDWIWWTHTKSSVDDCGQQLPTTWWSLFSKFFFFLILSHRHKRKEKQKHILTQSTLSSWNSLNEIASCVILCFKKYHYLFLNVCN